eukprot:8468099-Alexandrium_andersonii.AAC.1
MPLDAPALADIQEEGLGRRDRGGQAQLEVGGLLRRQLRHVAVPVVALLLSKPRRVLRVRQILAVHLEVVAVLDLVK